MSMISTPQNNQKHFSLLLLAWLAFAIIIVIAPHVFSSSLALSHLSRMGTAIVLGLSYNILLGSSGMLSFGHAAFSGLGTFMAIHAMNFAGAELIGLPLPLVPIVGGLTGLGFAFIIGYVITRTSGTTFAMITLGIGQMAFASALMFPIFFGGEGGISTNRVYGDPLFGWNFGPQIQVYYLIGTWTFICSLACFYLMRTPLGSLFNGVRDNPERVSFIGFNPHIVRYIALMTAGLFAGIGGALMAIDLEIATAENLSLHQSGAVLLFTFIGGIGSFIGPIIGAIVGIMLTAFLSDYTPAWQMYLGLVFTLVVVYAPGGISSLIKPTWDVLKSALQGHHYLPLLKVVLSATALVVGVVTTIELAYHYGEGAVMPLQMYGLELSSASLLTWIVTLAVLLTGMLTIKKAGRALLASLDDNISSLEVALQGSEV